MLQAEAASAEVLLYLQDGRDPSSEWQRRASPAARRNHRYPAVIQVGNLAVSFLDDSISFSTK